LKRREKAPLAERRLQSQQLRDFQQIARSKAVNAGFYLGRECTPEDEEGAIMDYLAVSRRATPRSRQDCGVPPRRLILGFHPLIYAALCAGYDEMTGEDPLAHYLRTGTPNGPWKHGVIQPNVPAASAGSELRILIHAHFHYPELFDDLLRRLELNASAADLFITTSSEDKAAEIRDKLGDKNERAAVVVVPNVGRDIGPLLIHFPKVEGYDIIGHLHGKRSPQQSGGQGDQWREFLWNHLLGGDIPMMDVIAEAFAADERLGLVFPEDPDLSGWAMNRSLAEALALRLKLPGALPPHLEFPKGNMFWARPAALRPLADLGWSWNDFPPEPVASDGTVLHTLERLIPFSVEHAGFSFKTVHVPHSWRMPERL
jgi:lipopolysaccharide biosynthesis protein